MTTTETTDEPIVGLKLDLMRRMQGRIREGFSTKKEAALFLGLHQPTVTHICHLNHERYSLEWLVRVAARLGLTTSFSIKEHQIPED